MKVDVCESVIYQMLNTPLRQYPFEHIYVENVFPEDFYQEILSRLPQTDKYIPIDQATGVSKGKYQDRGLFPLIPEAIKTLSEKDRQFWSDFYHWFGGDLIERAILHIFTESLEEHFHHVDVEPEFARVIDLIRDRTNYSLGPHTDSPDKLISLLFYLPKDDAYSHLGTTLFVPVDPLYEDSRGKHHPFDLFKIVKTMPFKPNSMFGFMRQDDSWHGVLPVLEKEVERNSISYRIKLANWKDFQ